MSPPRTRQGIVTDAATRTRADAIRIHGFLLIVCSSGRRGTRAGVPGHASRSDFFLARLGTAKILLLASKKLIASGKGHVGYEPTRCRKNYRDGVGGSHGRSL